MEKINYNLLSNNELHKKYEELTKLFREAQEVLKEKYVLMTEYSEESVKIKEIIKKRGGKI